MDSLEIAINFLLFYIIARLEYLAYKLGKLEGKLFNGRKGEKQ